MNKLETLSGGIFVDDHGTVRYVNEFTFDKVIRFCQIENFSKGFIRAWYGHKTEHKYFYIARGSALIGAIPINGAGAPLTYVLSAARPRILHIPPEHYSGWQILENDTIVMIFSSLPLDASQKEEDLLQQSWNHWNIWRINNY